jgi:archaellum component FlaC
VETAPHISDREIVERLTRLEEGQNSLLREIRTNADSIKQLREDMNKQFERIDTQFDRIDTQFGRVDAQFGRVDAQFDRIDKQFDRLVNIMLGIFGAFAAMCGGTIWFALWDRRTMIRPFEDKVKKTEDDIAENRTKLHTLLEAFKTLSKTDEKVANILKKFNLL